MEPARRFSRTRGPDARLHALRDRQPGRGGHPASTPIVPAPPGNAAAQACHGVSWYAGRLSSPDAFPPRGALPLHLGPLREAHGGGRPPGLHQLSFPRAGFAGPGAEVDGWAGSLPLCHKPDRTKV